MAEEATINPDGTQDFPSEAPMDGGEVPVMEDPAEVVKGTDPAIFLILLVIIVLVVVFMTRKKKSEDDFFNELDGEKFNLKLPAAVEEYDQIKAKVLASGSWQPGQSGTAANPNGPHRVLAQALMKRCIADIPIVQHIQKESTGMNKLYSQSMCSVNQWRSYQAAEQLVSNEVDEVRAEADEIEPGWSQVIWRQAMQYHNMLKQKHEQEAKAAEQAAAKKKEIEGKVNAEKQKEVAAKKREEDAERLAQELIQEEERTQSKKAFSGKTGTGMKKGFLNAKGKK